MKIAIIGYSGCGKSTLALKLSKVYHLPVCHLDALYHLPNWESRPDEEFDQLIIDFMNQHEDWIIEGTYSRHVPKRFEEADVVIALFYNRFVCLRSVIKRYKMYKNDTRPDMAEGCQEKLDFEFIKWVLWKGRSKKKKKKLQAIIKQAKKGIQFKSRRACQKYLKKIGIV